MTSGHTAPEIFPFVEARHKEAGLHPVTALKESSGFIFNRIWAAIKREVLAVLAEGVSTPEVIDGIWREQYSSPIGPCAMMDGVGLDTVEHIEQHYVDERGLPPKSLQWLQKNFIEPGKLGLKSDKGGLYAPPAPGSRTKILFLNLGLGEPLANKSLQEIMNGGEILSITAEDRASKPIALVRNQAMPDGIDACDGRMYWTNMGNPSANDGTVLSANLADGSDVQTVIPAGAVHTPKQLHIDQDAKKLYFCDREGLRVMRCNLDGSSHETLIQLGDWESEPEKAAIQSNWPVGITVSRKTGKFMWSQKGGSKASDGTIYAASLDMPVGSTASDRKDIEVIQDNLPECIDLEVDDEAGVLYWTSRGELPLGNTLNKKQITGPAPAAEKALGHQIVSILICAVVYSQGKCVLLTCVSFVDRTRPRRRHRPQARQSRQLHLRRRYGREVVEVLPRRRAEGEDLRGADACLYWVDVCQVLENRNRRQH